MACGVQAGVRSLSRNLAAMCRHVAVQIVSQQDQTHAQPHQQQQESSNSITSEHSQVDHDCLSSTHPQQQRQQQLSCVRAPQDVHASSDQLRHRPHADVDASALGSGVQSGTTPSAGSFFLGGLWGGLKGALTPPRQHPSGIKRCRHSSHQLAQAARDPDHSHMHPADLQMSHAGHDAALAHAGAAGETQHPYQQRVAKVMADEGSVATLMTPAGLASAANTAGSEGLPTSLGRSATSVNEGQQASNPDVGINSDVVEPGHGKVQLLTVTAELIEEVLGPRRYNETDSADSLVAPGDLQTA